MWLLVPSLAKPLGFPVSIPACLGDVSIYPSHRAKVCSPETPACHSASPLVRSSYPRFGSCRNVKRTAETMSLFSFLAAGVGGSRGRAPQATPNASLGRATQPPPFKAQPSPTVHTKEALGERPRPAELPKSLPRLRRRPSPSQNPPRATAVAFLMWRDSILVPFDPLCTLLPHCCLSILSLLTACRSWVYIYKKQQKKNIT